MLDKEQGRCHRNVLGILPDNVAVKEGLQVIVAMVLQILLSKDGINIGQGLEALATCFIIYYTDLI